MKDLLSIWESIRDGDEDAFDFLYKTNCRNLVCYAYGILRDQQLAEEIVHDVFINLWFRRREIIISESVKSYLYRSVHNGVINCIQKHKTRKYSAEVILGEDSWKAISESLKLDSHLIEAIEAEETEKVINDAIYELPDQCRKIFIMSRYEGRQNDEISAILDISVNTVRTQIFRAINKIRQRLSEKFPGLL